MQKGYFFHLRVLLKKNYLMGTKLSKNLMIKAMGKNQHVVPNGEKWAVKGAGNERATKIVETQKDAMKIAREIAINQHSEVIIHGKDGTFREKNSYGNDPKNIKG